jgi:DNA-binding response OmpR family regulator
MRPKKRILLAASQEHRASELKFMLETNGYAVAVTATPADAVAKLPGRAFDLLLVDWPFDGYAAALDAAFTDNTPSLVLAAKERERPGCCADDVLLKPTSSLALLDRIKVMSVRNRGPKSMKKPVVSLPAVGIAYSQRLA